MKGTNFVEIIIVLVKKVIYLAEWIRNRLLNILFMNFLFSYYRPCCIHKEISFFASFHIITIDGYTFKNVQDVNFKRNSSFIVSLSSVLRKQNVQSISYNRDKST